MWFACHFLRCKYLLLLVALVGLHALQADAAVGKPRGVRPRSPLAETVAPSFNARDAQPQIEDFQRTDLIVPRGTPFETRTANSDNSQKSHNARSPLAFSHKLASIPEGADLTPGLPQHLTNGRSLLGTKNAAKLRRNEFGPRFLSPRIADDDYPVTGVTRNYSFDVNYAYIAPDGVERDVILINGNFPGPTIEANYGDWIEVEVTNSLPDEGTSLHWHGLLQKTMPWMDGVPSIQQCPIAPGTSFTYRFRADQVGTTWWHSHFSAQYTSGAYGALIIHGENEGANYDEDLGPVFISDWYHEPLSQIVNITEHNPLAQPPPSDNLLINGKMNYPCQDTTAPCTPNAGVSKFFFSPGKKYRLRLINSGAAANAKFSIDGHTFTVIAQDFTPLVPYETDLISLGNGQRCDVIVEAVGAAGSSYWMRNDLGDGSNPAACNSNDGAKTRTALAAVYYDGADENSVPTTESSIDPLRLLPCSNDPLNETVPADAISAAPQGTLTTIEMHINFSQKALADSTVLNQWSINDVSYEADYSRSLLERAVAGNTTAPEDELSLYDVGNNGTVRIIIYDHFPFAHHPMHLHGHNFQVLQEGYGVWDGSITNPDNPSRRDVQVVNRALLTSTGTEPAYTVIQFFSDNPGVWPFHCHLAWHNSAGLYVNLLTRPNDVQKYDIPYAVGQTCVDWDAFANVAHPVQPDAGP